MSDNTNRPQDPNAAVSPDALKADTAEAIRTALEKLDSFSFKRALASAPQEEQREAARQKLALQTALLRVRNKALAEIADQMGPSTEALQSATADVKASADRMEAIAPWLNRIGGLLAAVLRVF